ncbi:hypothetical protein ACHHYP_18009 [Achlya hypogyna]|uniref:EF-hand domain-containing protein n=1 Tax=Achlya hypogyna TaxID=1202772 RepID=A0A1V9Z4Q9_ACHHY|nr:hypothetical protein ACHHYP_18009 [Achlya hypogyna]
MLASTMRRVPLRLRSSVLRRVSPALASRTFSVAASEPSLAATKADTLSVKAKAMAAWEKFTTTVIDDQLDIKTFYNVQAAVKQLQAECPIAEDDAFLLWLDETFADKSATLDKAAFEARVDEVIAKLQELQAAAWTEGENIDHNPFPPEKMTAIVHGMHYLYVKLKCEDIKRYFALLDNDNDGTITGAEVHDLISLYALGTPSQWLERHFRILDSDRDGAVTEAEMQQLYLNICGVHKSFVKALLAGHTANMTKAHEKQWTKALSEFEFKFKLTEKLRCMWHFAGLTKEEQTAQPPPVIPPRASIDWALMQQSQAAELPEFDAMLGHYVDAVHDTRREFYVDKDAKRITRIRSAAFIAFVTVTDIVLTTM